MIKYIKKAAEQFIEHQIRLEYTQLNSFSSTNNISTYIEIVADALTSKVTITYSKELLQQIATIYIMEDNCDDTTLTEMALETTNMIVGSAKTLASENECHFNIKIPFVQEMSTLQNGVTLAVNNNELFIQLENS